MKALSLSLSSIALVALLGAGVSAAQAPAVPAAPSAAASDASMPKDAQALKSALLAKFPGAEIRHVAKAPFLGLYEVVLDDRLIYTDPKASYVIVGSIYDTATKTNLTEERQRKLTRVAFDDLPLTLAMKKVKGNGSRRLVIFSDADCPFCARLENEMKSLDNVTIYTFLFPIDQLHPDAARKSKMIWCAPDKVKAWDEWFAERRLPDNGGDCPNPVAETQLLGAKLRVNATPTLVFADGSMVPGAIPLARIEQELNNGEAEAKKLAAAKKP